MPRASRLAPLEVIMVPLQRKRVIHPPNFPPYPKLYLELLENKEKIKRDFLKQEFVPKYQHTEIVFDDNGDERPATNTHTAPTSKAPTSKAPTKIPTKASIRTTTQTSKTTGTSVKPSTTKGSSTTTTTTTSKAPVSKAPVVVGSSKDGTTAPPLTDEKGGDILHDDLGGGDPDPLASFLKKSHSIGSREKKDSPEKREAFDAQKDDILRNEKKEPPSLAELQDGGAFDTGGVKNMNNISKREQDQEQKLREYLFKYDLLRKSYPDAEIPKFTINSDPEYVAKTYDDILRNLSLSDNINKYKKYLMFGFMGVEALVGNVLGFDMKGFTKQQVIEMSSYEKLLIELGEKNYVPQSKWPVELRLMGMIIMNAAFFVASKMALRATGTDVLGSMNAAANAGVSAANLQQRKKQKMSGPSINLDDIPNIETSPKAAAVDPKGVIFVK